MDLDAAGPKSLQKILLAVGAETLPAPTAVIRSSKNRYQVLWNAAAGRGTPHEAEDMNRRLAGAYNGDRATTDISRVMRLPGYRNKKSGREDAPVTWTDYGGGDTVPADFIQLPEQPQPERARSADRDHREDDERIIAAHHREGEKIITQSERDWAWCREELRYGASVEATVGRLEARRQDKSDPAYYARHTVLKAQATIEAEQTPQRDSGIER